MSADNNNSYNDISLFDPDTQQFYLTQFWVFLFLIIPSMTCSLFGLYHFLLNGTLRQALYNHIIIVILIIDLFYQVTDMFCFIHYFRSYKSFSPSPTFRLIWGYIDWSFYFLQVILYTWATIERHILIFHDQLVSTRKKRIFIHYLPPIILTIYCQLYYAVVYFISPCENSFDDLVVPGFVTCAFQNTALFMYEIIVHQILPIFIIVISSIILLLRVLWQKYRVDRQIHWRRYRKMTIQVLPISSIYLILNFPAMFINILHLCGVPSDVGAEFLSRAIFFTYYTLLLFPIVSIGSLPELIDTLKKMLQFRRQQRAVAPRQLIIGHMATNQVVIPMKTITK